MTISAGPAEVTMIWNYPNWGGAQIYFLSIVRNARPGWKMRLILPRGASSDITKFFEPYGVEVSYLRSMYVPREAVSLGEKLKRQWERIRSEAEVYFHTRKFVKRGSIVHIEAPPWQSWVLLFFLARRFQTIATVHNSIPALGSSRRTSIWKWRLNFLMKRPRFQIFAANQDAVDNLRSYIHERYWDKISLTRAAINPLEIAAVMGAPFDRAALRRRVDLSPDGFIVLCVGQFIDRKGRWVFIEAAKRAKAASHPLSFVWVGPEPLSASDAKGIAALDVDSHFTYILSSSLGPERKDVLSFFRIADVFVLASFLEGLPISIMEALALGLPVVSTNINAIPEAIKDGETGLLIEPGDVDGLLTAVTRLSEDEELRSRLAVAGRSFALETFDERLAADVVFVRYRKAVGQEI